MEIEKISYYRYDAKDQKHILMSLPRVKWLERDPDYKPPQPLEVEQKIDRRKDNRVANRAKVTGSRGFRPQTRNDDLSPAQKQAWELQCSGLLLADIGVQMNRSSNAVGKLLAQAREKLGIGLK
jgi:hypothetical protein